MIGPNPDPRTGSRLAIAALLVLFGLWAPGQLAASFARFDLAAPSYRYGALDFVAFALRAAGLAAALAAAAMAVGGHAAKPGAAPGSRWRHAAECLLLRAALGLLVGGLIGLAGERWALDPRYAAPLPAAAALLLGSGFGASRLAAALGASPRGAAPTMIADAAPALLAGLLADPAAPTMAWAMGPFVLWFLPRWTAAAALWMAAAFASWLWAIGPAAPRSGPRYPPNAAEEDRRWTS